MAEQDTKPKNAEAVNGSVSGIKQQNDETVKEHGENSDRNADGTFRQGNRCAVGNKGGRPIQQLSYRVMAKVRSENNPQRVQDDLDRLDEIIDDENSSPADVMRALDMKIRLNDGYDPVENKVSGEVTQVVESPLNGLTIEELRKLKALKQEAEDGKEEA